MTPGPARPSRRTLQPRVEAGEGVLTVNRDPIANASTGETRTETSPRSTAEPLEAPYYRWAEESPKRHEDSGQRPETGCERD